MSEVDKVVAFKDEVMLLGWAESNTRGRTVTFLLNDEGDAHPFRDFTVKSGKKAGQRFAMVLVQIGDDEEPVRRTEAQEAFLMCKDERFWHWLNEHTFFSVSNEEEARSAVLESCGIKSRSEIDKDPAARARWLVQLSGPFKKHIKAVEAKTFAS